MRSLLKLAFLLLTFHVTGQPTQNANDLIEQSDTYYVQRDFEKALELAGQAYNYSKATFDKPLMALSLQKEARALLRIDKKAKINRKLAQEKLNEAMDLIGGDLHMDLRLEILESLHDYAVMEDNKEEIEEYHEQIEALQAAHSREQMLEKKTEVLSTRVNKLNRQVSHLSREQLEAELMIARQHKSLDSLTFQSQLDSLTLAQQTLILSEQTSQLKLKESQRNFSLAMGVILLVIFLGLGIRFLEMRKLNEKLVFQNEIIKKEKVKSEKLLLNILPKKVANELKAQGSTKARNYPLATVLFSDFENFSSISKTLSPSELVSLLDEYFRIYDDIISKYELEKIKTIGDAYMCAGGVPQVNDEHPIHAVRAALDIQSTLRELKKQKKQNGAPFFEARIGIHSGPVIAGVVGSRKFAFDIWGDTVNIASRIENEGLPGKVNISADTYDLIKDQFHCTSRGKLPIKNRGEIEMYFVDSKK